MNCGGVPVASDQLAGAMNQEPVSGSFRLKIATARIFGLIETVHGRYQLTELGFGVVDKDPARQRTAKADAFLHVPLYKRVYDEFRSRQLPPRPLPLEHAFVGFGVSAKQKVKARIAFDRSAQQAGYFEQGGKDRLIRPVSLAATSPAADETSDDGSRPGGGANGGSGGSHGAGDSEQGLGGLRRHNSSTHPFIQGLLDHLPQPETTWAIEGRAKWLRTAADIFDLMYKGSGEISIKVDRPEGEDQ